MSFYVFTFYALSLYVSDGPDNLCEPTSADSRNPESCPLILKTMPSCPGLTPMLHSTIGLTAGSAEHSLLHQWKPFRGGHLHFKEKTFSSLQIPSITIACDASSSSDDI